MAQELARVTVQGLAQMLDRDSEKHTEARKVYLARFPDAASLFEFSDFNIFIVKPISVRLIAGFGRAVTITGDNFATSLAEASGQRYPFSR
jgi:putative heme iron utilization protein